MRALKGTPTGRFSSVDQVRRWHKKMMDDWPELVGAHEREAQAHDAIAFLLGLGEARSMEAEMQARVVHELNMRDALERF